MSGNLLMAIGTPRSRAEDWIRQLPERFSGLDIRPISREALADLDTVQTTDAEVGPIRVVDAPYTDIEVFHRDAQFARARGWEVFLQYFPAEPLIQLIQKDQTSGELLGAETLRESLRQLLPETRYIEALDT